MRNLEYRQSVTQSINFNKIKFLLAIVKARYGLKTLTAT